MLFVTLLSPSSPPRKSRGSRAAPQAPRSGTRPSSSSPTSGCCRASCASSSTTWPRICATKAKGAAGTPPAGPELMGEGRKTPQDAELCSGCLARTWLPPDCERLAIKALIFLKGRAPPPLPLAASLRGGAGDALRRLPVPGSLPWQPPALQEREQQHGALWGHPSAPRHPLEVLGVPVQAHYPLPISLTTQPALENACWFNQERARPVMGWLRNDGQPRCSQIPEHSRG